MYYITGDTHGDFTRIERFCERFKPTRDDVMIILGDAGFNFFGGKRDRLAKQRMAEMPITIFSIHGQAGFRPIICSNGMAVWCLLRTPTRICSLP